MGQQDNKVLGVYEKNTACNVYYSLRIIYAALGALMIFWYFFAMKEKYLLKNRLVYSFSLLVAFGLLSLRSNIMYSYCTGIEKKSNYLFMALSIIFVGLFLLSIYKIITGDNSTGTMIGAIIFSLYFYGVRYYKNRLLYTLAGGDSKVPVFGKLKKDDIYYNSFFTINVFNFLGLLMASPVLLILLSNMIRRFPSLLKKGLFSHNYDINDRFINPVAACLILIFSYIESRADYTVAVDDRKKK